jgi:hypothetical protein
MKPNLSAGEAVPAKSTSRRLFIKGALLATSAAGLVTTTAPLAARPLGAGDLQSLIEQRDDLDALYEAAEKREAETWKTPGRPMYPQLWLKELGICRYTVYRPDYTCMSEKSISAHFDRELEHMEMWKGDLGPTVSQNRLDEIATNRAKALAIYRERQAAYEGWKDRSGYTAAYAETARLARLVSGLEDQILAFRPRTMNEVRVKAAFFLRVYADTPPEDFYDDFMKSLLV